jgi:hypothetical protein
VRRSTRCRLSDAVADAGTDGDAAVHPGAHLSERDGDTEAHQEPQSLSSADAYADSNDIAQRIGAGVRADGRTEPDTAADVDADTIADRCVGESWSRGARAVRFRRDDRRGRVDLAAVSELSAGQASIRIAIQARVVALVHHLPTP